MIVDEKRASACKDYFRHSPGGRPGLGLLLLRVTVALKQSSRARYYLANSGYRLRLDSAAGSLAIASGTLVLVGFLTPAVSAMAGICFLCGSVAVAGVDYSEVLQRKPGRSFCNHYGGGARLPGARSVLARFAPLRTARNRHSWSASNGVLITCLLKGQSFLY